MVKWIAIIFILLIANSTPVLAQTHHVKDLYYWLKCKVHRYERVAQHDFAAAFKKAHVAYPPKEISLLVFKDERKLELWARNTTTDSWHYIQDFTILAASGGPGPKLRSGDYQVPEGIYQISSLNPFSHYNLSMMINYPNAYDRLHAQLDHRHFLGGNIFIHGSNVSTGCIAIGDDAIEDLFVLAYKVGVKHIKVIIAPNDLRIARPILGQVHPYWLNDLDLKIKMALKPYHKFAPLNLAIQEPTMPVRYDGFDEEDDMY